MMGDGSKMYLNCVKCNHVWVGLHLPMEMSLAGKLLKKAYCVVCGAQSKDIVMASKEQAEAFDAPPKNEGSVK